MATGGKEKVVANLLPSLQVARRKKFGAEESPELFASI